ncbi:MAG: hypothetical protein ACRC2H_04485 [Silanimonas sp.]
MLDASNPLVAEVKSNTEQVTTAAGSLVIDSPEMYELAGEQLREIKAVQRRIDETRKLMTKPLDDSKKAIMDFFRPFSDAADSAEASLKRKMLSFQSEQTRIREAAERAARAEREAAERTAEELRRQADAAIEEGDADKALESELAAEAVVMEVALAAPVAPATPKAAGIATRDNWVAQVTDFAALIKAAAERPDLAALLLPNDKALNQMAKALKEAGNVPGVRFYNDPVMSARGK